MSELYLSAPTGGAAGLALVVPPGGITAPSPENVITPDEAGVITDTF